MQGPPGAQNTKGRRHSKPQLQWAQGPSAHCRLLTQATGFSFRETGPQTPTHHGQLKGFLFLLLLFLPKT